MTDLVQHAHELLENVRIALSGAFFVIPAIFVITVGLIEWMRR
jgi:hypothetical protein